MNENVFSVYVPGRAVPQGSKTAFISKSTGRPVVVDKDVRLPRWRATITQAVMAQMVLWDRMEFPLRGPIAMTIVFIIDRPKSHYGSGRNSHLVKASSAKWPQTMPDIDKMMRAILDACTDAQVFHDDGQVCWIQAVKRYPDTTPLRGPGVHITLSEML